MSEWNPSTNPLAFALHPLLARGLRFAGVVQRCVTDLDLTAALIVRDHEARARDARAGKLVAMRRRAIREQLLAAAENDWDREDAHRVYQIVREQRVHEFSAALGDEVRAVLLP